MLKIEIPRVECEKLTPTYGKFVIEPLERGYGHTLGNSITKLMLYSITGVAVKWLKIEGVKHEFSSIPDVVEDSTEVSLNVKRMIFKTDYTEPFFMYLNTNKPGEIKAGDFTPYQDIEVEILNPDLHIATVKGDNCNVSMEICAERSKGYFPAEEHKNTPDEYIPVDSLYTPIRKVDYYVQDTRVGQITDYDKLVIEIFTNGVLTPDEALDMSARMFQDYLNYFIALSDDTFEGIMKPTMPKLEDEILHKDIEDLNFSVRSFNCLRRYGIVSVGDLIQKTEEEIMNLRNFGKKSLDEIKFKLAEYNLLLKQTED